MRVNRSRSLNRSRSSGFEDEGGEIPGRENENDYEERERCSLRPQRGNRIDAGRAAGGQPGGEQRDRNERDHHERKDGGIVWLHAIELVFERPFCGEEIGRASCRERV